MRTHLKVRSRILAMLLCMLLILPAIPINASAKTIAEVQAEQDALKSRRENLEAELSSLQNDEANAQARSNTLTEKIGVLQEQIDTTRQNINDLNNNITELERKLRESEAEYDNTLEQLKERIKVLYKAGDVNTLEILLSSTSLYDFSMRTEMLKGVTAHDKDLMEQITDYMVKTEKQRTDLKQQKEEVARLQKQQEADQEELQADQEENNDLIAVLQSQQADAQQQIADVEQEDEALNSELQQMIADKKAADEAAAEAARKAAESGGSSDGNTVYVPPTGGSGGGLSCQWPLPGYSINDVTQYYGNNGHRGMDIGIPYGSPITAGEAGEVLNASYHWSWGNNVLIYHNGTYSTRYAHMSSIAVSEGDYVSKGQIIGYVGSTGNSTGPHLHLEVYLNGDRVDPYPYLSSLS